MRYPRAVCKISRAAKKDKKESYEDKMAAARAGKKQNLLEQESLDVGGLFLKFKILYFCSILVKRRRLDSPEEELSNSIFAPKFRDVSTYTEAMSSCSIATQTIIRKKSISVQTVACMPNPRSLPTSPTGRPRMPLECLSNTRFEQVARDLANFHRERSPSIFTFCFLIYES